MKPTRPTPRRAYLNPNMNPPVLYGAIKRLAILHPQVVVWSPIAARLHAAGFTVDEFVEAMTPGKDGYPAVIPAGRDIWYREDARRSHVDPEARVFDVAFERRMEEAAERASTILPIADVDRGYGVVDALWESPVIRQRVEETGARMLKNLDPSVVLRINDLADRLHKPASWAAANAIAQDIRATTRLHGDNYNSDASIAKGFGLFTDRHRVSLADELPRSDRAVPNPSLSPPRQSKLT